MMTVGQQSIPIRARSQMPGGFGKKVLGSLDDSAAGETAKEKVLADGATSEGDCEVSLTPPSAES
jgi:hypothetical protein